MHGAYISVRRFITQTTGGPHYVHFVAMNQIIWGVDIQFGPNVTYHMAMALI